MIILYPGRFQPFHNIHLRLLKKLLGKENRVVIVIGSSDLVNENNPFTARQRKKMIKAVIADECLDSKRISFALLPNEEDDSVWVTHLLAHVPKRFDAVFSNNPRVTFQLKKHGIKCISTGLIKADKYSASIVRSLIKEDGAWKKLVPKSVAKFITSSANDWV